MIVFVSNFFNHHQKPVADELYRLTSGNYRFIEMEEMPKSFKESGYPIYNDPYIIRAWQTDQYPTALKLIEDAEVVIYGGAEPLPLISERLKNRKITIEVGERWLKKGLINLLSPNLLKWLSYYHFIFKNKPVARLCSGGYCKNDMKLLKAFNGKCFKWGYFPTLPNVAIEELGKKFINNPTQILWVSRFIKWKHPELVIELSDYLRKRHLNFKIKMYGEGVLRNHISDLVKKKELTSYIEICGAAPHNQILKEMQESPIFLLTSDQNEGWGAVVNEAMGCGCCVIANRRVGAAPYLINNMKTGIIYNTKKDLFQSVTKLLEDPYKIEQIGRSAYKTIHGDWSAKTAAENLYTLITEIIEDKPTTIKNGPCSLA